MLKSYPMEELGSSYGTRQLSLLAYTCDFREANEIRDKTKDSFYIQ